MGKIDASNPCLVWTDPSGSGLQVSASGTVNSDSTISGTLYAGGACSLNLDYANFTEVQPGVCDGPLEFTEGGNDVTFYVTVTSG